MKFITVREAKATLSGPIAESQEQRVVITRHGKPACILIGCEGYEIEDVLTAADPSFWKMLEERRRKGSTLSLASVRERFARKDAAQARSDRGRRTRSRSR
jgi:PHD/YefM family antitoxin component YafN of YafNO toxin-antitoxin module